MKRQIALLLALVCIAGCAHLQKTDRPPKLPQPSLIMYGYSDADAVRYSGFWLEREQWEKSWKETVKHYNIITGKTKDAGLVKRLRAQNKIFAYHVNNTRDAKHQTVEDFVRDWSKPFEDTLDGKLPGGFDAISIDELHSDGDGTVESETAIAAVRELRRRYPQKLIIAWGVWRLGLAGSPGAGGKQFIPDRLCDRQLQMVTECCDLFVMECYHREANAHLGFFAEMAKNLDKRAPGLLPKTIFGLGIAQSPDCNYDDLPEVDFGGFLDKQMTLLKSTPELQKTQGVALWAFYRAKPDTITMLNGLVDKHYGKSQ